MTPSPFILKAIVAAHRAVACEEAAEIDVRDRGSWIQVAEAEHRKKRQALAQLEFELRAGGIG